jgi:alpha-D-xyloside xylohydrolase
LWRDEHRDQAQVLEDAANIRKHDLAISALWIDRPYDNAVNDFGFNKKRYPNAPAMIKTLHGQGFRLGLWHTPYLEPKAKEHQRFKDNGWYVGMGFQPLNPWGDPVDLTNPKAFSAWQELIQKLRDLGIEGFKLDYGQDVQVGISQLRLKYTFHNGEDNLTMHHRYNLFYHRAYFEKLGKDGGFLINRGGVWGDQIYTSIVWPGDLNANFAKHYDKKPGEDKHYVGGLIASIVGGLTLSQSGYPLYGSDTGGYRGARASKEVMMRWGQQTAFSSIMQIGGGDPNVNPWDFTKYKNSQFDQELLDMFRVYIRLHTRLFPYIYTYAVAANQHKPGPTRPYGMAFPDEDFHPNDQYMLGEYLLVAPVVKAARKREVHFPKGLDWIHWWTGKLYKGGTKATVDAPLNQLPVFLKVGTLLPMLRPDIDTLAPTTDKTLVSFVPDAGELHVVVVPGDDADFTLYDKTRVSMMGVQPTQLAYWSGETFKKGAVFEVRRVHNIKALEINGKVVTSEISDKAWKTCSAPCWWWAQKEKRVWIRVGSGEQNVKLDAVWK